MRSCAYCRRQFNPPPGSRREFCSKACAKAENRQREQRIKQLALAQREAEARREAGRPDPGQPGHACPVCQEWVPMPQGDPGRPRVYCSKTCANKAARLKSAARLADTAPKPVVVRIPRETTDDEALQRVLDSPRLTLRLLAELEPRLASRNADLRVTLAVIELAARLQQPRRSPAPPPEPNWAYSPNPAEASFRHNWR